MLNMIKNIAQKVKNLLIMAFVMTDEEARQMKQLKEVFVIFINIILMELMDIPKKTTKILTIAISIATSLRKNGIELLTKRRDLITWRRAVARIVAINRHVSADIWINELKAADLEMMIIVEKISEKIGIQIKPIYASSIHTLISAAKVSNDALIKAVAAAKESESLLIESLFIPYDILYDLEWLYKIVKRIEDNSYNSMIAVINAAASNDINDDALEANERNAIWHVKKEELEKEANSFMDTFPNKPFKPNALISEHREKWEQQIESINTYYNEDLVRVKQIIKFIEMEMTFARKSKAIIAFVIANRQQ